MMRSILKEELIGTHTRVAAAKNSKNTGLAGTIIDETKNTITIKTKGGKKMLMKSQVALEIMKGGKRFLVDGKLLASRPEERIKRAG